MIVTLPPAEQPGTAYAGLRTRCIADVQPEQIAWLWPGRIAIGKLTILAGDPGLGKSLIALAIAATVSRGATWPVSGGYAPSGDVLLLSAEDDPADTIRPRLDAAGADCRRIHIIEAIRRTGTDGRELAVPFTLADDLPALDERLATLSGCRLMVIDPLSAYLAGADAHRNAEMRGLLAPLADLARRARVAVIAIEHLNKSGGRSAAYRVQGSIATVAAARAVHLVTRDRDDPSRRLVLPIKNNLAPDTDGLAYTIAAARDGAPVVCWESEPVTITAEAALSSEPDDERTARDDAAEWLAEELSDGPRKMTELRASAENIGHKWPTVQRAKTQLHIHTRREGFGRGGSWYWSLPPPKVITETIGDHPDTVITYAECDHLCSDTAPGDQTTAGSDDGADAAWTDAI